MTCRSFVSVLSFVSAVVVPLSSAEAQFQPRCGVPQSANCNLKPHTMLDVSRFADQIANELRPYALKGYSLNVFGEDGDPVPVVAMWQGYASGGQFTGGDPDIIYNTSVGQSIASVSKMLTQGAVRHAMEITRDAKEVSAACRISNDTPFLNLLPDAFRRAAAFQLPAGVAPFYADVKIGEILNHTGGVPRSLPLLPDGSGPDYWVMMNRGVADNGQRDAGPSLVLCNRYEGCYSNDNYVLATMMLPIIRDCTLKASIEAESATYCFRNPTGRSKDTCQIQRTFDTLSLMANTIVKEMVIDPVGAKASCDYQTHINSRAQVARAYANADSRTGLYQGIDPRGCGIGAWHMSTHDTARILRRFWDGSFFNHSLTGDEMPIGHNGVLEFIWNGVAGSYRSQAMYMLPTALGSESLTAMFSANSPIDTAVVDDIIYRSFQANQRTTPAAVSQRIMTTHRGTWDCAQVGAPTVKMSVRISNKNDIRSFLPADLAGQGAEEIWTIGSFTNSTANGRTTYFPAGKGPKSAITAGSWTIDAVATDGGPPALKVLRVQNGATWSYTCTRVDNR